MEKQERFFKVMKKYYLEGPVIITITNQSRRSINTMTESEIVGMWNAWEKEGCRIINDSDVDFQ